MTRDRQVLALLCGIGLCGPALWADDSDSDRPDQALFEFLGSWQGNDEDMEEFLESVPEFEEYELGEIDGRSTDSDSD